MTFEEYLETKKISAGEFALQEPDRFREFKAIFEQVHPESFTSQKLFLINSIRRKYPFVPPLNKEIAATPPAKMMKPKLNIGPK